MKRLNWSGLIRQIDDHRAPAAQFYKPTCLIAAIDLADEGLLAPADLNASYIIKRFSDYVTPFHGARGEQGHKPLWHLSNDGIWTFFRNQDALNLRREPKSSPASKLEFFRRFDRLAISDEYTDLWAIPRERRVLRDAMLLMLSEGSPACQKLVAPLFNTRYLLEEDRHPSPAALVAYFKTIRDQLHLFEDFSRDEALPSSVENPKKSVVPAYTNSGLRLENLNLNPVEGLPSPVNYDWRGGRVFADLNPNSVSSIEEKDDRNTFKKCLEACDVEANLLLKNIRERKWQVGQDYGSQIEQYLARLPSEENAGNIILADNVARALREMFKADASVLPSSFAARLKIFLQIHYALRSFFPEIKATYQAMSNGKVDTPLPLDAVDEVIEIVKGKTPVLFDESVSNALVAISSEGHEFSENSVNNNVEINISTTNNFVVPPDDPLGDVTHEKAADFQNLTSINAFWKVFKSGEAVKSSIEAWTTTYQLLIPHVSQIIGWLQNIM